MGGTLSAEPLVGEVEAALAPGDLVDGLYRIERLLGRGGAGAVYQVRHEGLDGARFALKVLHPHPGRSPESLAREGRLAAGVRSPHVVKVAALGQLPGGAGYLVTELVDGPTLEALVAVREPSREEALDCARQLCLALEAAHGAGLVHGDVSLRNVFATPKPDGSLHLQLGDFGLARRVRREAGGTVSLELGAGRGTPRYMAPEAIAGDALDERSDLFSVGVILYRLLAGAFPFEGAQAREILAAVLSGRPAPLADGRPSLAELEPLVMGCLAHAPGARPESARTLRLAIEAAMAARPARWTRWWVRFRRRRMAVTLAAAAGLVAAGAGGLQVWRARADIPIGPALSCGPAEADDAELGAAAARALCARIGASLDVDWGGGTGATAVRTSLNRTPEGEWRLEARIAGRQVGATAGSPRMAALDLARRVLERADPPPLDPAEIAHWGASDAATAARVRAVFRSRTALVYEDLEATARAVLAFDPDLPLIHLVLADVVRHPERRRAAQAAALAHADRLPAVRAAAVRAFIAAQDAEGAASDRAVEALRLAYGDAPDDPDVGVLYQAVLVRAGRAETARTVAANLHERFPRKAALAFHHAAALPERDADASEPFVAWLVEALPEQRASTAAICLLVNTGRLEEAEAALAFADRFGLAKRGFDLSRAVVALASGDPERIEQATASHAGSTGSWSQQAGARLRLVGLQARGRLVEAAAFAGEQMAAFRAADDAVGEILMGIERLRMARLAGAPSPGADERARLETLLASAVVPLPTWAQGRAELALGGTLDAGARRTILAELDAALLARAGADAHLWQAARLRLLPLVRVALGEAEVAARWRDAGAAWLSDRVRGAYDAAPALEAAGDAAGAEAAWRLAASPYDIDRHAFEAVAARLHLARLNEGAEAVSLRAHVAFAWSEADPGLAARVRAGQGIDPGIGPGPAAAP